MRGKFLKASLHKQPFMIDKGFLDGMMGVLNSPQTFEVRTSSKSDKVIYSQDGDVAIIAIDGAMYKNSFNGECGDSVISYPSIIEAINIAENEPSVKKILLKVDTPGGSVAGADNLEEAIRLCTKPTTTFYHNQATSAGMYCFLSSDKVYSAKNTILGSIGVVTTMVKEDENNKIHITSSNAPNKACTLESKECMDAFQAQLDTYEKSFYSIVMNARGVSENDIKTAFNNGGTAFETVALEYKFIDGIMSYREVLQAIKNDSVISTPTQTQGESMTPLDNLKAMASLPFSQENFTKMQDDSKVIAMAMETQINRKDEALAKAMVGVSDAEAKLQEMTAKFEALSSNSVSVEQIEARILQASALGMQDGKTLVEMIKQSDDKVAGDMAIASVYIENPPLPSGDGVSQLSQEQITANAVAFAKKLKGVS